MIDSGLGRLQIGIESGNEKILNCYNKSLSLDDIRETVQVCFEEGLLSLVGNFIIGGPFETLETLDKSLAFAKGTFGACARLHRYILINLHSISINKNVLGTRKIRCRNIRF